MLAASGVDDGAVLSNARSAPPTDDQSQSGSVDVAVNVVRPSIDFKGWNPDTDEAMKSLE